MAQKVTLKVSAAAAAYVRPDAPKEEKMKAARGDVPFHANDLGTLLFFLSRDLDPDVKGAAVSSLRELPGEVLITIASSPETHPLLLDTLARIHSGNRRLAAVIFSHPEVEARTLEFLAERGLEITGDDFPEPDPSCASADEGAGDDENVVEPEDEPGTEGEERFSKYKLLLQMSIGEKIKMAMVGDKEWRSLLIKDNNKLVSTAVIKNPRITDPEILAIAKSAELNEEVIRLVSMNKEWVKIYPIRKALVENCKTALPKALRFLSTLNEKDILALSKSRNISSVIARQAQRLHMNKRK